MNTSRKLITAALAATVLGTGVVAGAHDAEAGWRYRRGPSGGAVAAGMIGGLAAGALIASAARPAYAYPAPRAYYAPPPEARECWMERRHVRVDPWTTVVKRVEVCD